MAQGIVESKEEMKEKMEKKKKGETGEKERIEEIKKQAVDKTEEAKKKGGEFREQAMKKKEEARDKVGEIKKQAMEKKEELEEKSEAEGMTPAEKLVNDVLKGFRQRTEEINKSLAGYAKEYETPKPIEKPLVDVLETNETVYVIADLPEVKKEDLDLGISKNSIEISARFNEDTVIEEDAKFIQKERSYGETKRSIELPTEIKPKDVTAKFKGSTLIVKLPKAQKDITKVKIEGY